VSAKKLLFFTSFVSLTLRVFGFAPRHHNRYHYVYVPKLFYGSIRQSVRAEQAGWDEWFACPGVNNAVVFLFDARRLRVNVSGYGASAQLAFKSADSLGFFFRFARSAVSRKTEAAPLADDERRLPAVKISVADHERFYRDVACFAGDETIKRSRPSDDARRVDVSGQQMQCELPPAEFFR
jgi:hypothetical protein